MFLYGAQSHLLARTIQFLRSEPVAVAPGHLDGAKDVLPHPLADRVGVDIEHLSYLCHTIETRHMIAREANMGMEAVYLFR